MVLQAMSCTNFCEWSLSVSSLLCATKCAVGFSAYKLWLTTMIVMAYNPAPLIVTSWKCLKYVTKWYFLTSLNGKEQIIHLVK
jgi:hypothetical protein